MDFTVNINAPAIAEAFTKLAEAITAAVAVTGTQISQNAEQITMTVPAVQQTSQNAPAAPIQPVQQTVPNIPQVIPSAAQSASQPFQNVPQTPPPVATPTTQPAVQQTAPTVIDGDYQNKVCNAAARLLEQNKMQEVLALLGSFGVAAITQLTPEQLPEFAKGLVAMGAVI